MSAPGPPDDAHEEHAFADSNGVRIHYIARGQSGPLLVMIRGFPDFWFTWRLQIPALAADHRVIAIVNPADCPHPCGDDGHPQEG
jgi:pimeloyl-ACP methyl ester carboxylesterase